MLEIATSPGGPRTRRHAGGLPVSLLDAPELVLDRMALEAEIEALAQEHEGDPAAARAAIVVAFKVALQDGRERIRQRFLRDRLGRLCAERLSRLEDELIRAIYAYVTRFAPGIGPAEPPERVAVVAVGGYGRATLAPGSDIDLLVVLPPRHSPWCERVAEAMLYVLWDLGQKVGHATRTVEQCVQEARADMTIRTTVLEARLILGDRALMDELAGRFQREIVTGTAREFVAAKLAEREQRVIKAGKSRYRVEPNVKEGKGGLRDLNTLYWITRYVYSVGDAPGLVRIGLCTAREARHFERAEEFLWATRCALHFLTRRADDRLTFELQREIADMLGYVDRGGMWGVERFMKHYFLAAKDVGDLTAIVCAALEERETKPRTGLDRFLSSFRRATIQRLAGSADFVVENGRINARNPKIFQRDPVNLIRVFHLAGRDEVALHPALVRLATQSLKLIDASLRENPEANRLFLEILTSRHSPEVVLRRMNEAGVLGRFIPEFGRVVSMMQFNMYHHYTVDEHLLRSIGELSEIDRGDHRDEHPVADDVMATVQNRIVLYVATFLHDIAKGRPEDHSLAGARIARKLCPRFGLSPAETESVAWLIEQHLAMSMTAQSRDLGDRKTIETFAGLVQSLERLKMLFVLTVADIRAVGPGVWNSWKGQLLRTLFWETEPVLAGGHSSIERRQRVQAAQDELRAALRDRNPEELEAYIARLYPPYWLRTDLAHRIRHAALVRRATLEGRRFATEVSTDPARGVTELVVLAPDHVRLLSIIAGACVASGANIVDAQISTTTDGLALDTIALRREFADDQDEFRRGERIAAQMERILAGEIRLPELVASRAGSKPRPRAFRVPPEVVVDNDWSNRFTVLEVSALDRPGLLYELTTAISELNLNIASAHIATFGEKATDVFYVTDLTGQKIVSPPRQDSIRSAVIAALGEAERQRIRRSA